jgi:hypothetical protein
LNLIIEEINPFHQYTGDYRTLCLKQLLTDSTFLEKAEVLLAISDLLKELKKQKFIKSDLIVTEFIKLFGTGRLTSEERFIWLKSNFTLKRFVLIITNSGIIVPLKDKDKWLIAANCFVKSKNEELLEYDPEKLENSRGSDSLDTDGLHRMINEFVDLIKKTPK